MSRLVLFLGSMIGSTLAFVFVVAALVAGVTGLWPLLGAAAAAGALTRMALRTVARTRRAIKGES